MRAILPISAFVAMALLAVSCGSDGRRGGRLTIAFPATVVEGAWSEGSVAIPKAVGEDIDVSLTSSDTYYLQPPSPITIPAGQTQVAFVALTPENHYIDPDQSLTLTASHPDYMSASLGTVVTDNEPRRLGLGFPADPLREGAASVRVTVYLEGEARTRIALAVSLYTDDQGKVDFPSLVTISAGANSAAFDISPLHDVDYYDDIVLIRASCASFVEAWQEVVVVDDDV